MTSDERRKLKLYGSEALRLVLLVLSALSVVPQGLPCGGEVAFRGEGLGTLVKKAGWGAGNLRELVEGGEGSVVFVRAALSLVKVKTESEIAGGALEGSREIRDVTAGV